MTEFEQWNIEFVRGEKRNSFVVLGDGGHKTILKTRADVVLFLDQNKQIKLSPSDFVFKKELELKTSKILETEVISIKSSDACSIGLEIGEPVQDSGSRGQKRLIEGGDEGGDEVSAKIKRVTVDSPCDHIEKFQQLLLKIHEIRQENAKVPENLSSSTTLHLKNILLNLSFEENPVSLVKEICQCPELLSAMKVVFHSQIETEVELNSVMSPKAPVSMTFPPSSDANFYCSVVEEAAEKMPNFLSFLVNIVDSDEQNVTPTYVIKLATVICDLLSAKDKRHSTLKKLNALHLLFQRSSVSNVNTFNKKGEAASYSEGMRMVEECAELSEYFKTSNYNLDLGMQLTMDNVDIVLKNKLEHWILCYSRMDPIASHSLSNSRPGFDINQVTPEVVYLKPNELDYLNSICRTVLSKKVADFHPGFSVILKSIPFEPLHSYSDMFEKQEVFVECLEPLNEMEHGDMAQMLSMCQKFILSRLNTLTGFKYDSAIQATINKNGTPVEIESAEAVVETLLNDWGEVIVGGDLLTVERIDQNKSLRLSNLTQFERLDFLGPSRIALFHLHQNLVLKLYAKLLPSLEDSDNPGSLNCFRALTEKAKDLSNKDNKIKDSLEIHRQFLLAVSEAFLEEKLQCVLEDTFGETDLKKLAIALKVQGETELTALLDKIIGKSNHQVFFDKEKAFENSHEEDTDDLENMANLFVSVWFILKSFDFITKTGDSEGIMFYKKNSVLLTLSLHSTSSKYVHQLFHEMIEFEKMSDRQRLRFSSGHFIKYHGKVSQGEKIKPQDMNVRAEDMVCEWYVEKVKNTLKSLGGNYTEETIEKKTKATSLINAILEHDNSSLLLESSSGPGHSWNRFEEEELKRFGEYVRSLQPFRPEKRKRVTFIDKRIPRSLYSSLSSELITRFFKLKLDNMS